MGGKEAVAFGLVGAEKLFGFNATDCDPLKEQTRRSRKERMEPVCRGKEIPETRPEQVLVQHCGRFYNLRAMINSCQCTLSSTEEQKCQLCVQCG